MKLKSEKNNYELKIVQNNQDADINFNIPFRRGKEGLEKAPFNFTLTMNGDTHEGIGSFGNDGLWLPLDKSTGVKILRASTPEKKEQYYKNVDYIKEINSDIFPDIYDLDSLDSEHGSCVLIKMENVQYSKQNTLDGSEGYIPPLDKAFIESKINNPLPDYYKCISEFTRHRICPEDDWFKNSDPKGSQKAASRNMFNGKLVDFHDFKYMPERYVFPSNGCGPQETERMYKEALLRYRKWMSDPSGGGMPKWKGTIYQGMQFDNGYVMPGYSSNNHMYDSFIKLHFMPMNKVRGKKVLDLGSNQGFFSFQSALHGASEVLGIELTPEDVQLANEVNQNLLKFENVRFKNGDIVEHIKNDDSEYELIILNSVLHQIYKDMIGSEEFLHNIAKRCKYFVYETPVNHHKLMSMPLEVIYNNLVSIFGDPNRVRLLHVYDAYSTGYRANFVCYTHG